MPKYLVVFIVLIALLIFIIGCPSQKAKSTSAQYPQTSTAKAPLPAPAATEPNIPQPSLPEPNFIEPNIVEPNTAEIELAKSPPAASFHEKCAPILKTFVDENGMVDYKALKWKRLELIELINEFAKLSPDEYDSWPKEDKTAFWINAYNIQLLKIIVSNYPIQSSRLLRIYWGPNNIRHIKGIWDEYKFIIMDEEFTLNELEKRFFRNKPEDPRIFFALSKASLSGPLLRNESYSGEKLYQQLEEQTKKFLSNPKVFKIDKEEKTVFLPAILQSTWYGKEFLYNYSIDKKFKDHPPATRAVLNFITNYISEAYVAFLELENYSVRYIAYNWNLNE
ncbi:MAG: DUF547 domain-containing protein [Planctomycetota bacterium]|jgi:hypothetical protein